MPRVPTNNIARPEGPSETDLLMALAIMNNLGRVRPKDVSPKDVEAQQRRVLQGTNPQAIDDIDNLEKQGKMRDELATARQPEQGI